MQGFQLMICDVMVVVQDFARLSIADVNCGGTFANFNERSNQSWVAESKAF